MRVSAGIHLVDGRLAYPEGALPYETPQGMAVDVAVMDGGTVALSTAEQPFDRPALAALARHAGPGTGPALLDATDRSGAARRVYLISVNLAGGRHAVVVASTPLAPSRNAVARSVALVAALSLAALVAGGGLTYWLVGRALRPVSRIAALAETLSERELHRRVDVDAPEDEVGSWCGRSTACWGGWRPASRRCGTSPRTHRTSCAGRSR